MIKKHTKRSGISTGGYLLFLTVMLFMHYQTHSQTILRGRVIDSKTTKPLQDVKVGVSNQGVGIFSNSKGQFFYNKYYETLSEQDTLYITRAGYEPVQIMYDDLKALTLRPFTVQLDPKKTVPILESKEAIKIFWDTSEGMSSRDIGKELQFIVDFVATKEFKKAKLVVFSNKVHKEISLETLSAYDMSEIIYDLEYSGPSNYSVIQLSSNEQGLLMSNGIPNYGKLNVSQKVPFYSYSSIQSSEGQSFLNNLSNYTSGKNLSDFTEISTAPNLNSNESEILSIRGVISSSGAPIQNAEITLLGSLNQFFTKADGSFEIPAKIGDRFNVKALGMFPKAVVVNGKDLIDIELLPSNQQLDEVVVVSRKRKIYEGDRIIEGYDIEGIPGGITARGDFYITNEDIKVNGRKISQVIRDNFVGVQIKLSSKGQEYLEINGQEPTWRLNGLKISNTEPLPLYLMDYEVASVIVKTSPTLDLTFGDPEKPQLEIRITTKESVGQENFKNSLLVNNNDYNEQVPSVATTNYSSVSKIRGVIKSNKQVVKNATVSLKGTFRQVKTDDKGIFDISARVDDILIFTAPGMFKKEILIENTDLGVINLQREVESFDELVITGEQRQDNTIVATGYNSVNKDAAGYSVSTVQAAINAGATTLSDLIRGRFAGVTIEGGFTSGSETRYKIRGGYQSLNLEIDPLWLVNGIPYTEPPTFLDVQFIESITVLKSLAATSRYGSQAVAGVFIIKTRESDFKEKAAKNNYNILVTGNDYDGNDTSTVDAVLPEYIIRFRESGSPEEQFKLYKKLSRTQESPLEFYVDAAQYFQTLDPELGDKVRSDLAYIARNNTKALRTLSYLYEMVNDTQNVQLVNERILKIAPQESQSYRDLALAYQNNGYYEKSLELYINMLGEQIKGVSFDGLEKPLRSELSRLVNLYKDKIDFDKLPNEWLRTDFKRDVRIVIDWSDRTVPFEFQFVNPERKFFVWNHSLQETKDRLKKEQEQGFQTEEFIIDDAPSGEWLINVQYLGSEGDYVLPPFLKYTVYRDYGTSKESKEVNVVKLFKQQNKVTLGKIIL